MNGIQKKINQIKQSLDNVKKDQKKINSMLGKKGFDSKEHYYVANQIDMNVKKIQGIYDLALMMANHEN